MPLVPSPKRDWLKPYVTVLAFAVIIAAAVVFPEAHETLKSATATVVEFNAVAR